MRGVGWLCLASLLVGCRALPAPDAFAWPDGGVDSGVAVDSAPGDTNSGEVVTLCGNGSCDDDETVAACPVDCHDLYPHLLGTCAAAFSQATCPDGYWCVERSVGAGGPLCVANFPTWPLPGLSRDVTEFSWTDDTVTDARTGLMWSRQPFAPMGQVAGSKACTSQAWGGFGDWRLPTRAELQGLVDYALADPCLPAVHFAWSATWPEYLTAVQLPGSPTIAVTVDFRHGAGSAVPLDQPRAVRCVRGGSTAATPGARFSASANGLTVEDRLLGRTWLRTPLPDAKSWSQARSACTKNVAAAPGTGWRLPTVRESDALIEEHAAGRWPAPFEAVQVYEWTDSSAVHLGNTQWMASYLIGSPDADLGNSGTLQGVRCIR